VLLAGADARVPLPVRGFRVPGDRGHGRGGTPVLTSNVSSLPEVAGDDAVLVDPKDEPAVAEGLRRILSDLDLRERLIGPAGRAPPGSRGRRRPAGRPRSCAPWRRRPAGRLGRPWATAAGSS
jgi:glycosyltransferase involved in cell wall biosynthesis